MLSRSQSGSTLFNNSYSYGPEMLLNGIEIGGLV